MIATRIYVGAFIWIVGVTLAGATRAGPPAEDPGHSSPETSPHGQADYPVVLRFSQQALKSLTHKVDQEGDVKKFLFGTDVTGSSRTTGNVAVRAVSDRGAASFDVVFQGQTRTRNVGIHGPAIIYSSTQSDFVCTRAITFEPRVGFVAAASEIDLETRLSYDGFDSTRPRLIGRFVRRVAERKSQEVRERARQIAAQDNEQQVREEFDKALDDRLAELNRRLNTGRIVNTLFGESAKLQVASCTSPDCAHVGIGREGSPVRLTSLPPRRPTTAPVELWVHPTVLGKDVAAVVDILSRVENGVVLAASRLAILSAMSVSQDEPAKALDVAVVESWLVIIYRDEPLPNSLVTTAAAQ